jgi:hypothetical protein
MLFQWRLISIVHTAECFLAPTPCYVQVLVFLHYGNIFYSSGYDAASMGHWIPTLKGNVVPPSSKMLVCDLLILENEGNVLPGNVQFQFSIYAVSYIGRMEYSSCHVFSFMIFVQDVYIQLCQLHISYLRCRSTVILSSYVHPNIWSNIIPSGHLTETLYAYLMFIRHAALPIHFIIFFWWA